MNGRPALRCLRRSLEYGEALPNEARQLLIEGLRDFENGAPLDNALSLRAAPALRSARNRHLCKAVSMMPERFSVADCARHLHDSTRKLEAFVPDPRGEDLFNGWQLELLRALRFADLPGARQLQEICSHARDRIAPHRTHRDNFHKPNEEGTT